MMSTYFNYGDFENSILYLLGGIELVFVSIAITWISGRVQDRYGYSILLLQWHDDFIAHLLLENEREWIQAKNKF